MRSWGALQDFGDSGLGFEACDIVGPGFRVQIYIYIYLYIYISIYIYIYIEELGSFFELVYKGGSSTRDLEWYVGKEPLNT